MLSATMKSSGSNNATDSDHDTRSSDDARPTGTNDDIVSDDAKSTGTNNDVVSDDAQSSGSNNDPTVSDEAQIDHLGTLFRELLVGIISVSKLDKTTDRTLRKKIFGLTKGLSPDIAPNNPLDYEQKYPPDKPGEILADNARVWLTYLDEADAYDRDKVEGWKDTVDVLLVFAGLFSGVITTFVSQASQSLQQDYTQVSASLLSEIAQLQRAQFSGTPVANVPTSTLTPTSVFIPTTNAFLVNGLWFTSLAISLATALIAVLTKQWLYYYMSITPGTALEKVRTRHFRFKGLEAWKVGLIIDLLPIFLHLALGVFLIGVIILLFPLDIRIAWAIVVITGITYSLYFISVILPIRYPDCPYTTSLATFVGNVFYLLKTIIRLLFDYLKSKLYFQNFHEEVLYWKKTWHGRVSHWKCLWREHDPSISPTPVVSAPLGSLGIAQITKDISSAPATGIRRKFQALAHHVNQAIEENVTNWREKNLNKAVRENCGLVELKALEWLYTTSSNPSMRRIVARGASVHPGPVLEPSKSVFAKIWRSFENVKYQDHTDLQELRHHLCMFFQRDCKPLPGRWAYTEQRTNPLYKEYLHYFQLSFAAPEIWYSPILLSFLKKRAKYPLVMWRYVLRNAPKDARLVAYMVSSRRYPFCFTASNLMADITYETGDVSFENEQLDKWIFDYLFDYFCQDAQPNYSSEDGAFGARYRLLVSIFRNLISDQPIIRDTKERNRSLDYLLLHFNDAFLRFPPQQISPEWPLAFCRDILCVAPYDKFGRSLDPETMLVSEPPIAYTNALEIQKHFLVVSGPECCFIRCRYEDISLICDAFLREFRSSPSPGLYAIVLLLFMPQNRVHLLQKLSGDLDATALSHLLDCLQNLRLRDHDNIYLPVERKYIYPNLMYLFQGRYSTNERLREVLYDVSVLVKVWNYLVTHEELDEKEFLRMIRPRLGPEQSSKFNAKMIYEIQVHRYPKTMYDHVVKSAHYFNHIPALDYASSWIVNPKILFSKVLCRRRNDDHDVETGVQNTKMIELRKASRATSSLTSDMISLDDFWTMTARVSGVTTQT